MINFLHHTTTPTANKLTETKRGLVLIPLMMFCLMGTVFSQSYTTFTSTNHDNYPGVNAAITGLTINGPSALSFSGGTTDANKPSGGTSNNGIYSSKGTISASTAGNSVYAGSGIQGQTYTLTMTKGSSASYAAWGNVFIDFNDNGSFNDAGEQIIGTSATTASGGLSYGTGSTSASRSFTLSATAPVGLHRMRAIISCAGGYCTLNDNYTTTAHGYADAKDFDFTVVASCTAPVTGATAFGSSALVPGSGTGTISFTRGSGDGGVVVIARAGSAPNAVTSGTGYTTADANTAVGSGTALGGGNIVFVENGSGSGSRSVNLTGLTSGLQYFFAIYEYNATANCYVATPLSGGFCFGAPAVANISASVNPVCSSATSTLSLTGLSSGTFYTYNWQYGATTGGESGSVGTNSTYVTPAPLTSPASYYICQVTCPNTSSTTNSNELNVNQNSFLNCYCTYASFTTPSAASGLSNVNLVGGSVTLNVTPPNNAIYTLTSSPNPDLSLSTAYTLKVTTGTSTRRHNINAWIDWDQNGVFGNNANEFIGGQSFLTTGQNGVQYSWPFTVPSGAAVGTTAMRIDYDNSATATGFATAAAGSPGSNSACTFTATAGEHLDYRVLVVGAACSGTPTPGNVYAGSSGTSSTGAACNGATTTMYATGYTTGVSGISLQWQSCTTTGGTYTNVSGGSGANTSNYTTAALSNATSSATHLYYKCLITCANGGGTAIQTTPVDITINPTPAITVNAGGSGTANATICSTGSPNSASLLASNSSAGSTTYAWSGIVSGSTNPVTATPATTGTYSVTGTANTCTASATGTVTVNPGTITFTPTSPSVALGGAVSITASATGAGTVTYAWSPNDGTLSALTGATVSAGPAVNETYTVTATDGGGCSRTGTVSVNVLSGTPGTVNCGYSFTPGSLTTYSSITGGTTLGSTANTNYTIDLSVLSTPFTFDYNGITYSQFGVNSNGWIYFGSSTPTASVSTPFSSGLTVDGVIAVMASSQLTGNTQSYVVTGTAPNRQLTIQWHTSWNSTATADFQVVLNEHGGSSYSFPSWISGTSASTVSDGITFNYYNESGELTHGGTIRVGLRGSTDADFNIRKQASGRMTSGSTSASISGSGGVNTDAVVMGASAWIGGTTSSPPAVQFVYNPAITTPTITPAGTQNVCTSSNLNLTGNSVTPASPTTWAWINFATGNPASGTNNASGYVVNQSAAGNYYYAVKVTNGSGCSRTSAASKVIAASCSCSPSTQATGPSTSGILTTQADINWSTNGNGTGGVIVFVAQGSAISTDPLNGVPFTANAAFASGTQIGSTGAYAVYKGTGSSVTVTGLLSNVQYYYAIYAYNSGSDCYLAPPITGNFTTANSPMTYLSSTTTQTVTSNVAPSQVNQQIIGIQVVASTGTSPVLNLTSITFNTNGSTNVADIATARIWSTGTSSTFATSGAGVSQFGSDITSPSGSVVVPGSVALSPGVNYFWIAYDIAGTATSQDVVDAECTSVTAGSAFTPTVTAPAGNRLIFLSYCTPGPGATGCSLGGDDWITSVVINGTGSTFSYTGATCQNPSY